MNQFIDCPMHLLFLGVTKACKNLLTTWISSTKRVNKFNQFRSSLFQPIEKMKLDWCKVIQVESGWVSENYIAFYRIMKWYYHPIRIFGEDEPFVEPEVPVSHWILPICKKWLGVRGLSMKGRVKELRDKITELKNQPHGSPKILPPTGCSVDKICQFVGSWLSMIAAIMQGEIHDSEIVKITRLYWY